MPHRDQGLPQVRAEEVGHDCGMTRWWRSYWADDDVTFYFEVDTDGFVLRQVEVEGPQQLANAACSTQEWEDAFRSGTAHQYADRYGWPVDGSTRTWTGHDLEPSTQEEFDAVWTPARVACDAGSRSRPDVA